MDRMDYTIDNIVFVRYEKDIIPKFDNKSKNYHN